MRRSGTGSGGGIGMNKVTHRTEPKREPRARAINPSAVNQLGNLLGDHITNKSSTNYRGEPLVRGAGCNAPVGPTNLAQSGPGAGRTVMRSGGQGTHGATNPGNAPAKSTDILRQFGPDYKR
jgi:hypothetical protein